MKRRCFTPIVAMVVWYWCEHHTHYHSNIRYAAFASNFTTHLDTCLCELPHCSPVAGGWADMVMIHCSTFGLRFFSKVSARACALGATLRVLSWAQRLTFFLKSVFFFVLCLTLAGLFHSLMLLMCAIVWASSRCPTSSTNCYAIPPKSNLSQHSIFVRLRGYDSDLLLAFGCAIFSAVSALRL